MRRGEVWRIKGLQGDQHVVIISADDARPAVGPPVVARIVTEIDDPPPKSLFVPRLSELDPLLGWVFAYSQCQPAWSRYSDGEVVGMLTGATLERVKTALRTRYEL